jgi:high-affinity nickel-transport protein
MVGVVAVAAEAHKAFHIGLVVTAFGFGFRHGIDWDHIAALTDITGSQDESRRSMLFATLYALGHALVVFVLGFAAIALAARLPSSVDGVMEHFVGLTLIVLGVYVFFSLVRNGRNFRMRSRWMLIFSVVARGVRRLRTRHAHIVVLEHDHEHDIDELHQHADAMAIASSGAASATSETHRHRHRHVAVMPDDPFVQYGRLSAFLVGMIHGVGAETPTQVLIFLAAAGAGGTTIGLILLGCFLVGLLTSNTFVAAAGTFGFLSATRNFAIYVTVSVLTASFSLAIGAIFLFGKATALPALFGG